MIKGLWLFILSFLFSKIAFGAEPQFVEISENDTQVLRDKQPQLFTGEVTLEEADEALRALMLTGGYERVLVRQKEDGNIEISGKPIRLIRSIEIEGQKNVRKRDLLETLELSEGDQFDRKRIIRAGEALKEKLADRGFYNALVEVSFLRAPDGNLDILFSIDEKAPCRIQEILIETENIELKARLDRQVLKFRKKALTANSLAEIESNLNQFLLSRKYLRYEMPPAELTYNVDKTQASIRFDLKQAYRYEFYFSGYKRFSLSDILKVVKLDEYQRTSLDPISEVAERIRRHYLSKGYPQVRVETRSEEVPQNFLRKAFVKIEEGPRVRITDIEIAGRVSRPPKIYTDFVKENSSSLIRSGYYNREDLDLGYRNLVTHLRNEGYLRARVQSSRLEYSADKQSTKVILVLDEGPLTQIQSIQFTGIKAFRPEELLEVLDLQNQTPLRLNRLEEGLSRLSGFYRDRGYLEMKLMTEQDKIIEYNERGTLAKLNLNIFEGPQVLISSISIEGNTFTKDYVIRQEIDLKPGDILTPTKVDESVIRLNRLGIFSRVNIRTLEEGTTIANRNIIISVSERDPGTFRVGVGANSERNLTLIGSTGVGYSNLWGTARGVSTRVRLSSNVSEVNYPEHEITLGYLEPFMFKSRTRGRVNLTQSRTVRNFDKAREITQIVSSDRVEFLLERDLTRFFKLTWKAWSLDSRLEFERNGYCPDSDPDNRTKCPGSQQQVAKIGPILDLDFRDNSFLPTLGSYSRLAVDYSNPNLGSSKGIEFSKVDGLFTHYYRVLGSSRWIWANSIRGGYIKNHSQTENSGIPASEVFLLGGLSSVRGFDGTIEGDRIPRKDELPIQNSTDLVIRDYGTYYLLKSEIRFPIYEEIGGVFFYDGGQVYSPDFERYKTETTEYQFKRSYRDAAGFGLRYNTPVGPVSLDFGFKLRPFPDESKYQIHFSIGTF